MFSNVLSYSHGLCVFGGLWLHSLSSTKKSRRRHSLPGSMLQHGSPTDSLPTLPSTMLHLQTPILPESHEDEVAMPSSVVAARRSRVVQFGALCAAEFLRDEPTASAIKHLADEDAKRRYRPHDDEDDPSFQEQNDKTQVTKTNSKILAAWESDFPNDDDDDDDSTMKRKRRRSSGAFSPMLLTPDDEDAETSFGQ